MCVMAVIAHLGHAARRRGGDRADVRQQRLHRALLPGGHGGDSVDRAGARPRGRQRVVGHDRQLRAGVRSGVVRRSCCSSARSRSRSGSTPSRSWSLRSWCHGWACTARSVRSRAESSLFKQIASGAKAIRGSKEAILLIGLAAAFGFTFGQEVVLFGPIAEQSLGLGYDATGWLFAAPGVGGIVVVATGRQAREPFPHGRDPDDRDVRGRHPAHDVGVHPCAGGSVPAADPGGCRGDHRRRRHDDDPAARRAQRSRGERVRHPGRRHGDRHGAGLVDRARSRSGSSACRSPPRSEAACCWP